MENTQNIKWDKEGLPNLDFGGDDRKQQCLRCYKKPALKDGSDDGEFYCKECIIIRNRIDKKPVNEDELSLKDLHPKRVIKDTLQLWEEKPAEEELE